MLNFRRSENGVKMSGDKVRLGKIQEGSRIGTDKELEPTRIRLIQKNPSPNYFVKLVTKRVGGTLKLCRKMMHEI